MDDSAPILEAHIIIRNKRLFGARRAKNLSRSMLSDLTGVSVRKIVEAEQARGVLDSDDKAEIAAALDLPQDYLFPVELDAAIHENKLSIRHKTFSTADILQLRGQSAYLLPETTRSGLDLSLRIDETLLTLPYRESQILRLRFGLDDGRSRTLEEVAKEFNVTRERIRQIESCTLRKLRHPSRSRILKPFMFPDFIPKIKHPEKIKKIKLYYQREKAKQWRAVHPRSIRPSVCPVCGRQLEGITYLKHAHEVHPEMFGEGTLPDSQNKECQSAEMFSEVEVASMDGIPPSASKLANFVALLQSIFKGKGGTIT